MSPARKKDDLSLGQMGSILKDGLMRARTRPTIHAYIPHDKQTQFHSGTEQGKLYIGGNRSGKTVGGIVEDIFWMRGEHPYRPVPSAPIRGRIVTVSFIEGIQKIIIPEISKWLPPSDLINGSWEDSYSKAERTLTLANGSTVELMSHDQKLEKFAGTSRHFVHFDEEPPQDIFQECKMRLMDTGGSWWITMTPVEGMTWVYEDLYEKGNSGELNIAVIEIDTEENPYLSSAEIEIAFSGLDDDDKKARKQGKFVQLGGLAFPGIDWSKRIVPPLNTEKLEVIKSWTHYASMDHGLNNPTAWLWHAVSPSGMVVSYDEVYDTGKLVRDYATIIHERQKLPGRRYPDIYVGDPAIKQRNGITGDSIQTAYSRLGIGIVLGNNDVKIGIDKMNNYLRMGKWVITENCPMLIKEMQKLRWKVFENAKKRRDNNLREELHKKNDHAPDSARYFYSLMPDLHIPKSAVDPTAKANEMVQTMLSAVKTPMGPDYTDPNFRPDAPVHTEWNYVDEYMGGYA